MNTIFPYIIYLYILIFVKAEQEILINLEMNKLNPKITNEIYSKEQINLIGLSIDDTESNGIEIKFEISSTNDSPNPFAASIKYTELTKGFSNHFVYYFNVELLYLINLNIENNKIFSFSCTNENNIDICGFYLNENLIDFDGNKFERDKINFNNEFDYILQNNTNTIIHYMNYINTPYMVIFPEINNEDKKPIILKYEYYHTIKCITFDKDNSLCIFIKQIDETMRNIIIKHFNISIFVEYNDINDISNELNRTNLSFDLSIINNYAFDIYKTDDNNIIVCFLVNEDNLQKIICYKNSFEQIINFSLKNLTIYKTCDIKKDDKPEFFNYEKISIIYVNNDHFKIILYKLNKSKYFIIDLNTLSSYITKDYEFFLLAKISGYKKHLYILNDIELTTKNNIQYLNLVMLNTENLFSSSLEYPIKPSFIYAKFFLEEKLGEVILSQSDESFFNFLNYSSTKFHYIELNQKGIVRGTYKYKDIPSSLLFNYQFIIYPQFCLAHTDDALKCVKCDEGAAFMPDSSLCFSEDEIPDHYYIDTLLDYVLKCEQNCLKCNMLKTGGYSECVACDENYYIYRYTCVDKCPDNTFFYSYKKNIKAYNYQQLMDINVCTDICEEGYTGYIYQINNNETINRVCVLNKYKSINDDIEQRFNEFLLLNTENKFETILKQENMIKKIINIATENDFNNINVEFLLYNDYIYNLDTVSKLKLINNLNILCEYYYNFVENYFDSIDEDLNLLINNNNIIYFLPTLLTLFKNEELLEKIYFEKINYYFFKFGQNLTDFLINPNEIRKINTIMNVFSEFINQSINLAIDYIDPDFDRKEFESNKYYRYQKGILLNENNIKIMNLTNNLFTFIVKLDQNLYYYQNSFLSFYLQKLSVENNDKEYILPQLGLSLIILGTQSNITTSSYTTNNISELIETKQLSNLKIILPPLKSLNNEISWNECSFGLIVFKDKYPLLNKNSTVDINPDFISINFFDKNHNIIKISNLKDDNLIKIIRKKPHNDFHMGNCVFYDENSKNLNDIGCNSFDLIDYIICTTNHLTDFTIASFSPSYLISRFNYDKESTQQEKIKNSRWIKDQNIISKLNSNNAIVLYINLAILLLFILLLIIKFFTKQEYTKVERIVEDSYVRYTINEDTETDKKILKYIIEKEIEYILKNRSDYENQKKQQLALECKNDVFNSDQKVITIVEDESDDDDEEEINDKKFKKVSFRNTVIDKRKNTKTKKYYKKESNYNLKKYKSDEKKGKNKTRNKEINIEMSNVKDKEDNDFIEIDETIEDSRNQPNKYKFSFNYKNNPRKSNITNTISHRRNSSYSNITNEDNKINNREIIKKQNLNERFLKNVKEQKQRLIYSIFDKTLNDIKSTGQNSMETSTNIIKRPSSLIGISNALNKVSNKDEEKILIKNEFFVIFKLILYILYQYEYRLISLFNKITLPITRNNLIFLIAFRLNLQLSICLIIAPRYFEDNYSLSYNILAIIVTIIISDIIYTIIEVILMKKKISTSTDIKLKGIIKFRQILECLLGYILLIFLSLFGFYNSLWVSLYLINNNIKCCFLVDYFVIILFDNLIYESLILCIKSFIFTYVVYQDSEGCIIKILEIFNKIFIFYLAE